jgi:hypothetical protein
MTEQAENERPFAFKRERRQSKGFQGLIQKEPVTKSPFKRLPSSEDNPLLPLLPTPASRKPIPVFTVSEHMPSHHPGTSPPRSSLVSRRMHGPRSFSGNGSLNGRRRRRKTVTFDERCDVVEFDREEEMEEAFVSDEDDYGEDEDDDFFLRQPGPGPDDSYESVPLDGDESITGLVDAILRPPPPPSTPPHDISLGLGAGTAGQPGKTYHTEHHPSPKSTPPASFPSHSSVPSPYAFSLPTHAEAHPPATPPRPSRPSTSPSTMQVPLGRSTHIERARAARMNDDPEWERELPESPSPMRIATTIATNVDRTADNEPVPRFGIHILRHSSSGSFLLIHVLYLELTISYPRYHRR